MEPERSTQATSTVTVLSRPVVGPTSGVAALGVDLGVAVAAAGACVAPPQGFAAPGRWLAWGVAATVAGAVGPAGAPSNGRSAGCRSRLLATTAAAEDAGGVV